MTSLGAGSPRRALIVGASVTIVCSLPVFFTGAMAVQLAEDLGFGTVGIGGAVAMFFGTMALTSIHLGRLVDRLGAAASLRIAAAIVTAAAIWIATFASSWSTLAAGLVVCGLAAALAQPAANRLIVNRVRLARLGTAFGLKQSAPPTASMLAGLSVPAIALTVGWRWAYGLVAVLAVGASIAVGPRPTTGPTPRPTGRRTTRAERAERVKRAPLRNRPTLAVLAGGFGMAFVASSAVLAFYVEAAVGAGTSPRVAGLVFAAGSLAAIATRLLAGVASDRRSFSPLRLSAWLLVAGAVGLGLLATADPTTMAFGAPLALAGTWGFPGLFWFALVSAYPETPGRITGAMAPAALGGIIGPIGFGAVATNVSYPVAWGGAALLALAAAGALLFGAHRLLAEAAARDLTPGR